MKFDAEKFCHVQGQLDHLSRPWQWFFIVLFSTTGLVIIIGASYVIYSILRRSSNAYILSLIITDLCFGAVFIPLLVIELVLLVKQNEDSHHDGLCTLHTFRVLFFMYFFSTRLMSVFFISLNTFIKTCKHGTDLSFFIDRRSVRIACLCIIWLPLLFGLAAIDVSDVNADKDLGTITYVCFFTCVLCIAFFYLRSYFSVRRLNERSNSIWSEEAIHYFSGIIIWFIAISTFLVVIGIVLLVLAHEQKDDSDTYLDDGIYIITVLICTLDAIANPIVYVWKFREIWGCCRMHGGEDEREESNEHDRVQKETYRALIRDNDPDNVLTH